MFVYVCMHGVCICMHVSIHNSMSVCDRLHIWHVCISKNMCIMIFIFILWQYFIYN